MPVDGNAKKWKRRGEAQWGALLKRFDASQSSVEAFCRREAVSTASFYRWRKRLDESEVRAVPVRAQGAPLFVDAGRLGGAPVRGSPLELKLDLGEGWVLHLVRG
jgi:hypothetical protein